jgi:predicted MFS family arabinose efflux permease
MERFPFLPYMLLAYGMAGILGPTIGGKLADITGAFHSGIILSALLVCAAFVLNAIGLHLAQPPETKRVCWTA